MTAIYILMGIDIIFLIFSIGLVGMGHVTDPGYGSGSAGAGVVRLLGSVGAGVALVIFLVLAAIATAA